MKSWHVNDQWLRLGVWCSPLVVHVEELAAGVRAMCFGPPGLLGDVPARPGFGRCALEPAARSRAMCPVAMCHIVVAALA